MVDVSASGTKINIISIPTFPQGFDVTELADDSDPLSFNEVTIAKYGMGVNGDLVTWSTAAPLEVTLNVIANSESDVNLGIILDVNRVAKNKLQIQDVITMNASYPDGSHKVLTKGKLMSGTVANSVSSDGKLKTKQYKFVFENKVS